MSSSEAGREGGSGTSPAGRTDSPAGDSGTSPAGRSTLSPSSASGTSPAGTSGTSLAGKAGLSPNRGSGVSSIGRSVASPRDSAFSGNTSLTSYDKQNDLERALLGTGGTQEKPLKSDEAVISSGSTADQNVQKIDFSENDEGNPYNFSNRRKWKITGAALLASFFVPMHGTSITVAARAINHDFGISDEAFPNSYWPVASWGFGCAVWIIVGLPLMEDLGIRRWFLINYVFFFLMIIPQALAPNFPALVISRFFSGGFGELPTSAVASIIPDLWSDGKGRSLPVSLLNLAVMGGLTIAPALFAPVIEYIGNWRWIFYIQLIFFAALFPVLYFGLEETRGAVILHQRAKAERKKHPERPVATEAEANAATYTEILRKATFRPFYLLCTEPVVLFISLWSAFSFGNVFLFTQSTEQVFVELYDWKFYNTAYILIPVFIGEIIGWLVNLYGLRIYLQSAKRNTESPGDPVPESRLYVSIVSSFVGITGGMFVYGWTSYSYIPWIAPAVGLAMVGFGIQTVVCAACDYLEDSYASSDYAASAVSALAFMENIFGSFLPFAATTMYTNLGFQWASSLLGILALLIGCGPVVFAWKGRWFRMRSTFMGSGGTNAPAIAISGQQGKRESIMS